MPIRVPSPMVQPCSMARWPTVTSAPITSGKPGSVWQTQPSWTLLPRPTVISSLSPRSTAPHHTEASTSSRTLPISTAVGAIQY